MRLTISTLTLTIFTKENKMITLTFDTWEEFDEAIAGIVIVETELAK
jgi:hypothetical protein